MVEDFALNRALLRFPEATRAAFAFLADYGVKEVESNPTFVAYQNTTSFINVYHGRSSSEIGAEFGLNEKPESRYGIEWMIEVTEPDEAELFRLPVATTIEKVEAGVKMMAGIVRRYGGPVFAGEL